MINSRFLYMLFFDILVSLTLAGACVIALPVIYDGRAPFDLTENDLDNSVGPYLTVVRGSGDASYYDTLLGSSLDPTPLWYTSPVIWPPAYTLPTEQPVSIKIDNTSIFVPGGGTPQYGFRRTELIAQPADGNHTALDALMEVGTTAFHFSIKIDEEKPLNYSHEYQVVFIEPDDGSHVFGVQLGSPFTDPTGVLPASDAHYLQVLDHALNVLYVTPFTADSWHNFAVQVDWDNQTLGVFYSSDGAPLQAVTEVLPNPTTPKGAAGQGDFHCGVLKLPIVNPEDPIANRSNVVYYGIQEGTTEGLIYSGIFVEDAARNISIGYGLVTPPLV